VLRTVEVEELTRLVADWLTRLDAIRRCGAEPSRLLTQPEEYERHVQVILDGKTLRGTLGHTAPDQPSVHLVALYEAQTGIVLAQQAVPDKGNEITVEAALLTPAHVAGRIVTADALHTQKACCSQITRGGGDYVLLAKANQPTRGVRTCASSLASRLPIAATGGKQRRGTRRMGGWNTEK
jgi:hypothetical protein